MPGWTPATGCAARRHGTTFEPPAGLGRTLLPVMPLQADIDAGLLRATPVGPPPLERVLAVCTGTWHYGVGVIRSGPDKNNRYVVEFDRDGLRSGCRVIGRP